MVDIHIILQFSYPGMPGHKGRLTNVLGLSYSGSKAYCTSNYRVQVHDCVVCKTFKNRSLMLLDHKVSKVIISF